MSISSNQVFEILGLRKESPNVLNIKSGFFFKSNCANRSFHFAKIDLDTLQRPFSLNTYPKSEDRIVWSPLEGPQYHIDENLDTIWIKSSN